MKKTKPNDALTVAEAAEFLGLRKQTLYNYRSRGEGPISYTFMSGKRRRVYYKRRDLERYAKTQARKRARAA